jgi:NAD(P)-dependent dehydrogenase (short-subunit alcohol dehydrogenase family)
MKAGLQVTMRHAVITGGSRGIGLAVALELDARGWGIFLLSQDRERLDAASACIKHLAGTFAVDLGNGEEAARTAAVAVRQAVDAIDLLVLSAGIFVEEPLITIQEEAFRRTMAVNLDANLFLTRHLWPVLRKGERPRIVVIGSTAAYGAYPPGPAYGVAKWALRGLAVHLRHELQADRIGVTYFAPGGTLTDMWDEDEAPPDRLLQPRDTAVIVAALTELSEQAVVDEVILRPMLGDVQ